MREEATVKMIKGTRVTLTCDDEGCVGCAVGSACSSRERLYEAENSHSLSLKPGDRVVVYLQRGTTLAAGLLVLALPLVLFLTGYLLAPALFGLDAEGARALCGLLGMSVGFGVALLYGRSRSAHRLPQIVAVHAGERLQ